ncbi:MAG TPA: MFS transporter [Candidatus Dormibacteraeota bacterium]|nr:MFS transporter [Candidatus Dormibacteraeota bacterium]
MIEGARASRRLALFVAAVFATESAFYSVVPPLVPELVRDAHLTTTEVGFLVAAYPAGILVAAIPSIALVGRRGVKFTAIAGLVVLVAATLAFGWGGNALLLDGARFVQGVGGAMAWAGALAWLTSTTPAERKGSVIGGAVGAALIGMVIGPAIGAAASEVGRGPVLTVMALVLGLLALAGPAGAPASPRGLGSVQSLLNLLRSRRAAIGNGLLLVIGVVGGTMWSLMPLLVTQRHGGAGVIAAILAVSYLLAALLNVVIGRASDRIGRLAPTLAGLAAGTVLLPIVPLLQPLLPFAIVCIGAQSVIAALWTPTAAMVSDGAEAGASGQAVGVAALNAAWAAGGAAGPVLAAWLAEANGFTLPFVLAGGLCAASAIVLMATYGRRDQAQRVNDATASSRG